MSGPLIIVRLPRPHAKQREFVDATNKRTIIRAGRRGGKTVGIGIKATKRFLAGGRVLYGAPTQEQIGAFWRTVTRALQPLVDAGIYRKNEVEHVIEVPGGHQRIKAKTCWNADTLRGDYADLLILDEWQLMNEDAWELVGAPMLIDTNGDAVFIYTPPSLRSSSVTKARDPRHAAKLYKKAEADTTGRWKAVHFTSHDNPYVSAEALAMLSEDMTALGIRQEIMAEDLEDAPNALWTRRELADHRVDRYPDLVRVVVAVDPPGEKDAVGSGAGIMVGGIDAQGHGYLLADLSANNVSPAEWGQIAVDAYRSFSADRIVGEVNNGGDMVEYVLTSVDPAISYSAVHASRGKAVRAEPVSARYEKGLVHHVGNFEMVEDELCLWVPGDASPHRLDALVWLFTELMLEQSAPREEYVVYDERVSVSPF